MRALAAYRGLLANRPLAKLLGGEFVSAIGDWLYIVAILIVIYRETNDATLLGLFGALRQLPYVVLSIPAGIAADRFDRRLILLVTDLLRGACMLAMAWLIAVDGPVVWIIAFSILAACGSTFFYPAIGSYLPSLVRDERQLGPANSAWSSLDNLGFVVGPALGGILVAAGGVTLAFVINAATFVVIAAVLWTLPPSHGRVVVEAARATVDATTAGSDRDAAPSSAVRALVRPFAGIGLIHLLGYGLMGGISVLTVIFATDILRSGESATGLLNTAIGIGGVTGAIVSGALVLRRRLAPPLLLGVVASGIGAVVLGGSGILLAAMIGIAFAAAGNLVLDVVTTTIFQRLVPDELRGRGTGILMALTTLTGAAGAFLLPIGVENLGPGQSFGALGIATIVLIVAGLLLIGGAADRAPTLYEATMERVHKLPLFAGVTRARLEAAMHKVIEVPVTAGTAVVTQGETADRFYIIEQGSFTVIQVPEEGGEARVLRHLGKDDVFGELGLLRREPRSATVTADTDGLLLALEREDFLALVGATGRLRGRMLNLYTGYSGIGR